MIHTTQRHPDLISNYEDYDNLDTKKIVIRQNARQLADSGVNLTTPYKIFIYDLPGKNISHMYQY